MSQIVVIADPHLVDSPREEYRWEVFKQIRDLHQKFNFSMVIILGDAWDRKDRHSGVLVNRTIQALLWLQEYIGGPICILSGNHDAPIDGENYYWAFLSQIPGIHYYTKPELIDLGNNKHAWMLPFSHNPAEDWKDLDWNSGDVLFIHQTVAGAVLDENGFTAEKDANPMPPLPNLPIYSGDVHRPQTVGSIVYVGTPYPTRFGETWECRCLILDNKNLRRYESVKLLNIRRHILKVSSLQMLDHITDLLALKQGDQIRIQFELDQNTITQWAETEQTIKAWALRRGLDMLSVEATFAQTLPRAQDTEVAKASIEELSPETILGLYAQEEKLSQEIIDVGLEILKLTPR